MEFEWDPAKSEATKRRRGIGFERAAEIFTGRTLEWPDERRNYGELRLRAVGESAGELLHVVYVLARANHSHYFGASRQSDGTVTVAIVRMTMEEIRARAAAARLKRRLNSGGGWTPQPKKTSAVT